MEYTVKQIRDLKEKQRIAALVLTQLPEWFGIPESTAEYVAQSAKMPFWAAEGDGKWLGFLSMKATSQATCEIYVMGVVKEAHRQGVGRALVAAMDAYATDQGFSFAQVKTVQRGKYPDYDQTNDFYQAVGYQELECFPTLWDEANPCQIYIKALPR